MLQTATAVRDVTDLLEMGTMCAEPVEVRCVSVGVLERGSESGHGIDVEGGGEGGVLFVE